MDITDWQKDKYRKWALGQIRSEFSLEAKMIKLRLLSFGHVMRRHD